MSFLNNTTIDSGNEELQNKLDEMNDELNRMRDSLKEAEEFYKGEPVNGDTVLFLIKADKMVHIGKVVSAYECVICQDGTVYYDNDITDKWMIPINKIQDTIHYNGIFEPAYDKLVSMNSEEVKSKQTEDYINERVVRIVGTLSDDKQFLVGLFTRNVRNGKIDFHNYKFMMELLFDNPDNEYDNKIDLRELRTICYNMYSIMNRISVDTYDEIYGKLSEFASGNGEILMNTDM